MSAYAITGAAAAVAVVVRWVGQGRFNGMSVDGWRHESNNMAMIWRLLDTNCVILACFVDFRS